jgi:hypothetical protein
MGDPPVGTVTAGENYPDRSLIVRVEDLLWANLPAAVWRRTPTLGLILSDGGWTRARTGAGLAAPVGAALLGLTRGAWRPADQLTYSYSTVLLCLMLAMALAGTGIGVWLWGGFVFGDMVGHEHIRAYSGLSVADVVTVVVAPLLLSYLLLAVLLISTPLLTVLVRGGLSGLLHRLKRSLRERVAVTASALVAAMNAGLWTQSFPLLIRPLWIWNPSLGSPDRAGIAPVQDRPWVFAVVALVAALGWGLTAETALRARIVGRRYQPVVPPARPTRTARGLIGVALRAVGILLLLAGLVPSYRHAVIALAILLAAFTLQTLVLPRTAAGRWWTAHLPLIARLAVGAFMAWLVAWQVSKAKAYDSGVGTSYVTTDTFAPLLYASVAAIAVMALLLPAGGPRQASIVPDDGPVPEESGHGD